LWQGDPDKHGRVFAGRLLRVTADKLEAAMGGRGLEVEVASSAEGEELELQVT
jgi:hypothetical protein